MLLTPPGSTCLSPAEHSTPKPGAALGMIYSQGTMGLVSPETSPQRSAFSKFLTQGQICCRKKEPAAPAGLLLLLLLF